MLHYFLRSSKRYPVSSERPSAQDVSPPSYTHKTSDSCDQRLQASLVAKPISNNHPVPTPPRSFDPSRNDLKSTETTTIVQKAKQTSDPATIQKSPPQGSNQKVQNAKKHSKEDVDAGNTLLIFLQELRKNHDQALSMPTSTNECNKGTSEQQSVVGNGSVSTAGLISEMSQNIKVVPGHIRNDCYSNDTSSSLSTDTRSSYVKKDESIKSESSNEGASSEDDQKLHIETGMNGPIRKRFRRTEFSSKNIERHNQRM